MFIVISLSMCAVHVLVAVSGEATGKCISGSKSHKSAPGPETLPVASACYSWTKNSCCNNETAQTITTMKNNTDLPWANFRWDVCPGKTLSSECREHFVRDLCFYECSPNVGPWLVPDLRKSRAERFKDVPICQSECDRWYEDCKDAYTCAEDWSSQFDWSNKTNQCKPDQPCRKFSEIYGSPKSMCENIFGGSFKYVYDDQPCFRLNFDPQKGNPNDQVATWKIQFHNDACMLHRRSGILSLFTIPFVVIMLLVSSVRPV